jgi:hypothetical protein
LGVAVNLPRMEAGKVGDVLLPAHARTFSTRMIARCRRVCQRMYIAVVDNKRRFDCSLIHYSSRPALDARRSLLSTFAAMSLGEPPGYRPPGCPWDSQATAERGRDFGERLGVADQIVSAACSGQHEHENRLLFRNRDRVPGCRSRRRPRACTAAAS